MAGLLDKLVALNNADLSKLAGKIDALRAKLKNTPNAKPGAGGDGSGASAEQLLDELEAAQRRGLR